MPVFAKTKLTIEDTCMPPRAIVELSYSGPDPDKIYPKVLDILRAKLAVPEHLIQEKEYEWDRSKLPEKFSMSIEAIKEFDRFSYMLLKIKIKGSVKPSKELGKEGEAKVEIEGVVRTEYPQDSLWERSILYELLRTIYHKTVYQQRFLRFKEECRKAMLALQDELKSFFEILPR